MSKVLKITVYRRTKWNLLCFDAYHVHFVLLLVLLMKPLFFCSPRKPIHFHSLLWWQKRRWRQSRSSGLRPRRGISLSIRYKMSVFFWEIEKSLFSLQKLNTPSPKEEKRLKGCGKTSLTLTITRKLSEWRNACEF